MWLDDGSIGGGGCGGFGRGINGGDMENSNEIQGFEWSQLDCYRQTQQIQSTAIGTRFNYELLSNIKHRK